MAFRWHSPLVGQGSAPTTSHAAPPPPPPPTEVAYDPAQQRVVRGAHAAACEAIGGAATDASGKVKNPANILRAVEAAGMRLGPQGAGTLLAFADAGRSPSLDEFLRLCVQTPGTLATVTSSTAAPTGPGLRGAFGTGGRPVEGRGAGAGGDRTVGCAAGRGHCALSASVSGRQGGARGRGGAR